MSEFDKYDMMYCDNVRCRVNTFERGEGVSLVEIAGHCPGCGTAGELLPQRTR